MRSTIPALMQLLEVKEVDSSKVITLLKPCNDFSELTIEDLKKLAATKFFGGSSTLDIAVELEKTDLLRMAMKHLVGLDLSHLLHSAAAHGKNEIAIELIKAGADVNHQLGRFRSTPLQTAIVNGHAQMICLLLKAGADPEIKNLGGCTSMVLSANKNKLDEFTILALHKILSGNAFSRYDIDSLFNNKGYLVNLTYEHVSTALSSLLDTAKSNQLSYPSKKFIAMYFTHGLGCDTPIIEALLHVSQFGNNNMPKYMQVMSYTNITNDPEGRAKFIDTEIIANNVLLNLDQICGISIKKPEIVI